MSDATSLAFCTLVTWHGTHDFAEENFYKAVYGATEAAAEDSARAWMAEAVAPEGDARIFQTINNPTYRPTVNLTKES